MAQQLSVLKYTMFITDVSQMYMFDFLQNRCTFDWDIDGQPMTTAWKSHTQWNISQWQQTDQISVTMEIQYSQPIQSTSISLSTWWLIDVKWHNECGKAIKNVFGQSKVQWQLSSKHAFC